MKIEKPKKKTETLSSLHKKLWKIFSEYIRRRNASCDYAACCSCGRVTLWKDMDAGHFISRVHAYLKYDERNVHAQCKGCNAFKQGNYAGYREFMIKTYGVKVVEQMELERNFPARYTREGLQLKIEEYKEKLNSLKRRRYEETP